MQDYKKLTVWNKAHQLVLMTYKLSLLLPKEETFGLASQIKRAVISIPSNIAEGCSRSTNKDIARSFQIALGSVHEVEYYYILCKDLKFFKEEDTQASEALLNEVKSMLITLIKRSKIDN